MNEELLQSVIRQQSQLLNFSKTLETLYEQRCQSYERYIELLEQDIKTLRVMLGVKPQ